MCCICARDVCVIHSNRDRSRGNGVGVIDCIDFEDVTSVCVCESVEGDGMCVRVWRGMGCVCECGEMVQVCV